jgi:hypothetical protein
LGTSRARGTHGTSVSTIALLTSRSRPSSRSGCSRGACVTCWSRGTCKARRSSRPSIGCVSSWSSRPSGTCRTCEKAYGTYSTRWPCAQESSWACYTGGTCQTRWTYVFCASIFTRGTDCACETCRSLRSSGADWTRYSGQNVRCARNESNTRHVLRKTHTCL